MGEQMRKPRYVSLNVLELALIAALPQTGQRTAAADVPAKNSISKDQRPAPCAPDSARVSNSV